MKLTVKKIQEALDASPYNNGKYNNYFHLEEEALEIIEEATKRGYIVRLNHTQAQWTDEGLEKAKEELRGEMTEEEFYQQTATNYGLTITEVRNAKFMFGHIEGGFYNELDRLVREKVSKEKKEKVLFKAIVGVTGGSAMDKYNGFTFPVVETKSNGWDKAKSRITLLITDEYGREVKTDFTVGEVIIVDLAKQLQKAYNDKSWDSSRFEPYNTLEAYRQVNGINFTPEPITVQ